MRGGRAKSQQCVTAVWTGTGFSRIYTREERLFDVSFFPFLLLSLSLFQGKKIRRFSFYYSPKENGCRTVYTKKSELTSYVAALRCELSVWKQKMKRKTRIRRENKRRRNGGCGEKRRGKRKNCYILNLPVGPNNLRVGE